MASSKLLDIDNSPLHGFCELSIFIVGDDMRLLDSPGEGDDEAISHLLAQPTT